MSKNESPILISIGNPFILFLEAPRLSTHPKNEWFLFLKTCMKYTIAIAQIQATLKGFLIGPPGAGVEPNIV